MNKKIFDHVKNWLLKEYASCYKGEITEKDVIDAITDANSIYTGNEDEHRWYISCFKVVEIDGMLIGYNGFIITGDNSASDRGLEYKSESFVEAESYEVTRIEYRKKVESAEPK